MHGVKAPQEAAVQLLPAVCLGSTKTRDLYPSVSLSASKVMAGQK